MKKKCYSLFFVLFACLCSFTAQAACTLTAKCAGGDWNAASTWNTAGCAGVSAPADGMIIVIPACATVTVNINTPQYVNMEIYVYGTLDFEGGQKINMCPGYIKVFPGGQLTGGTPGSKINICGSTVWNGGGTTAGPIEYGGGTTLPVELLYFNASRCNAGVCLEWSTASETNNDFFTIERTLDGISYTAVAEVDGAGTSTSTLTYSAVDTDPENAACYYRLKQTDYDASYFYSALVPVEGKDVLFDFEVYPNPNDGQGMTIQFSASEAEIELSIYDLTGKKQFTSVTKNASSLQFNPDLPRGMYFIKAVSAGITQSRKLVVN